MSEISHMPVVAISEYRSPTVVGSEYDRHQRYVRFDPHVYELLASLPNAVLPARACYHFTDRIPLPWFSIVQTQDNIGSNITSQSINDSIFPFNR